MAGGPAAPVALNKRRDAAPPRAARADRPLKSILRWRFEFARLGAWFAVFQVSFFLLLVVPLVVMPLITGNDSIYVP